MISCYTMPIISFKADDTATLFQIVLNHCAVLAALVMRYGPTRAPFWLWSWPAFHAPLAPAIHYLSMSVGVSPSTVPPCQLWSFPRSALPGVRCLRFVKMEMKKICTVAAFVAFFLLRDVLGVCMSFLIIFVFPVLWSSGRCAFFVHFSTFLSALPCLLGWLTICLAFLCVFQNVLPVLRSFVACNHFWNATTFCQWPTTTLPHAAVALAVVATCSSFIMLTLWN